MLCVPLAATLPDEGCGARGKAEVRSAADVYMLVKKACDWACPILLSVLAIMIKSGRYLGAQLAASSSVYVVLLAVEFASFSVMAAICILMKSSNLELGVGVCEWEVGQFFEPSIFCSSWL